MYNVDVNVFFYGEHLNALKRIKSWGGNLCVFKTYNAFPVINIFAGSLVGSENLLHDKHSPYDDGEENFLLLPQSLIFLIF